MNEHWDTIRQMQEARQKALIAAGILEIVDESPAPLLDEIKMREEHEKRMKQYAESLPPYDFKP